MSVQITPRRASGFPSLVKRAKEDASPPRIQMETLKTSDNAESDLTFPKPNPKKVLFSFTQQVKQNKINVKSDDDDNSIISAVHRKKTTLRNTVKGVNELTKLLGEKRAKIDQTVKTVRSDVRVVTAKNRFAKTWSRLPARWSLHGNVDEARQESLMRKMTNMSLNTDIMNSLRNSRQRHRKTKKQKMKTAQGGLKAAFGFLGGLNARNLFRDSQNITKELNSRFEEDGEALAYFRKLVRRVLICLSWISLINDMSGNIERQLKSFVDIANEVEESAGLQKLLENEGLAFDPKYYKANTEISISSDVQKILSLRPEHRTKDMCNKVIHGLQTLRSFAEYPLHMQMKLAKVAWFQMVPPKRYIIRQGHIADNFYFILAGLAHVKQLSNRNGEPQVSLLARLQRGESFGELALLYRLERTADIKSITAMDLLVIGRDAFFDIFMGGKSPIYLPLLKTIPFMRHWPLDILQEAPEQCLFHFYKRGCIIAEDSNKTEWIYIVKSGTCQVMKKLKAVKLSSIRKSQSAPQRSQQFPRLGTADPGPKVDCHRASQGWDESLPTCPSPIQRAMTEFLLHQNGGNICDSDLNQDTHKTVVFNIDDANKESTSEASDSSHESDDSEWRRIRKIRRKRKTKKLPTPPPEPESPSKLGQPGYSMSRLILPKLSKPHMVRQADRQEVQKDTTHKSILKQRARTAESQKPTLEEPCEEDGENEEVFVQVDLLQARDVFGLPTVKFDDDLAYEQPSFSLVSRGAEVIMLKKTFFAQHANDKVKGYIRETVYPYPDQETLQKDLHSYVEWCGYKDDVVIDFKQHQQALKEMGLDIYLCIPPANWKF
ncbi:unnamed protein product [Owenia fusiformis]|uniref:Uncharacterized protein n=1 Tax=Owenia fusiformis TaxID=6347 RepID=A0A8J1XLX2_OWEFU|nr:unnamed protein product [Owenia fusiformis]